MQYCCLFLWLVQILYTLLVTGEFVSTECSRKSFQSFTDLQEFAQNVGNCCFLQICLYVLTRLAQFLADLGLTSRNGKAQRRLTPLNIP